MIDKNMKFLIVGLGLIGGGYARALKKRGFTVYALDVDPGAIAYGLENGLIDGGGTGDGPELIGRADAVVLALYPTAMVRWVEENQRFLKPGAWVTDVSGVKAPVVDAVQRILRPDVEFISAHPMAGREVSGVRNSDDSIFRGANFIVVPTDKNTPAGIEFATELGRLLGFGRVSRLSPPEHDEMIGFLSQLTHAIAVSLMNSNDDPSLQDYTGDSFRDLTRIAKINHRLWSELFLLNRDVLVRQIDTFSASLNELREALARGDEETLQALFIEATARRKRFDR